MGESAQSHPQHDYRPDIDGLRAVAILGVVAYHAGLPLISGGFVGVDVFFVISGYLITELLVREIKRSGTLSIPQFYARRARRLLPALSVVLLATLVAGYLILPPTEERQQLAASAIASSFFVANHYFLSTSGGYFSGPAELKPLLHLWSLAVEEQFYLLWPLLLIVVARLAAPSRRMLWMRLTTVAIGATSFLLALWLVRHRPDAAFFLAPSRAWELDVGALLALGVPAAAMMRSEYRTAMAWAGMASIGAAYVLITPETRFPGAAALLPVMGAALLIWGNDKRNHWPSRLLSARPMVEIGKLSYAWYLWHWPILALARSWRLMESNQLADVAASLLALLLAALTLRYVEYPVRYGTRLKPVSTRFVLVCGASTISCSAALAMMFMIWGAPWPLRDRDRLAMRIAADHSSQEHSDCTVERKDWDGRLHLDRCTFGPADRAIDLVLWGDSHASRWTPLLDHLQQTGQVRYLQLSMTGCKPVALDVVDRYRNENCREFRRLALEHIAHLQQTAGLKGVIIAGRWPQLSGAAVPVFSKPPHHSNAREMLSAFVDPADAATPAAVRNDLPEAAAATLRSLRGIGVRVLVLLDPPELRYPVVNCVYVNFSQPEKCGIDHEYYQQNFAGIATTFQALADRSPSVRVIDPMPQFCDAAGCPAITADGTALLTDADHVSASAAHKVAAHFERDILWLIDNQSGNPALKPEASSRTAHHSH